MLDFNTLFKDHVATRQDHGSLSIITYQNPKDAMYGLRFIFDNDWSTLTITGDSLNAIFTNCNNMGSPDRLYQTVFASNKHTYPYGDYKLNYDIGYLADKSQTKIAYTNIDDIDYYAIKNHIETTLNVSIDSYDDALDYKTDYAFCCLINSLDNYIRFTGSLPDNPESLYTSSCSSLCQEDYGLIEDYLDKNYSNITMNNLINIPRPVNESLVLVFEGFKRAYETLENESLVLVFESFKRAYESLEKQTN